MRSHHDQCVRDISGTCYHLEFHSIHHINFVLEEEYSHDNSNKVRSDQVQGNHKAAVANGCRGLTPMGTHAHDLARPGDGTHAGYGED